MGAALFVDAIIVRVRDRQIANRPIYAAIGYNWPGRRTSSAYGTALAAKGGSPAMAVLTVLRNRGVNDVFFLVYDALKGLPEVVSNMSALTTVQS